MDGGEILLSVLRIGEENPEVVERIAGQTVDSIFNELKISTGRDASISEKVDEFLTGTKNFPIVRKLFQDDPSGFSLVDQLVYQIDKPDAQLFLPVPNNPRTFFDKGLYRTGGLYKHLYEIGLRTGIQAPKPKSHD